MNTEQHPHDPHPEPPPKAERPEMVSGSTAPEAIQAADVDHNQNTQTLDTERPTRGVDWVRPSDLLSRAGGAVSRRGVDFQADLFRRARSGIATGARQAVGYARRLPPLSAFGREEPAPETRGLGRE